MQQKSEDSSKTVTKCQVCGSPNLESVLFLGFLPPVNHMQPIGQAPHQEIALPAQMLFCKGCTLVQLGLVADPEILFPKEYPYTSSTTKVLRDNFSELYQETMGLFPLDAKDLVVDIGSNDGNLLSNFKDKHRVQGVTPEDIGQIAIARGIPTIQAYFNGAVVKQIKADQGQAKMVTATNVFAHIDQVHSVVEAVLDLLTPDGVFMMENHYLLPLVETLQYDTIYHEHLRYYSLQSLMHLLESHGLEAFHVKEIPTHGGSFRTYAARKGKYPVKDTVRAQLAKEKAAGLGSEKLADFAKRVLLSKLQLMGMLRDIKMQKSRVYGISAPSRASTLVHYVGLDDQLVDCVLEVNGSHKVGKYMPGTLIPVVDEQKLFTDQPEYALLFSWHIADELVTKLRQKGYRGKFIIPLPEPRIV